MFVIALSSGASAPGAWILDRRGWSPKEDLSWALSDVSVSRD